MTPAALAELIQARAAAQNSMRAANTQGRFIAALAGPPAAGKSTLAAELAAHIGAGAKVVPMDGFHYDDAVLLARGARGRKGAPDTFDAQGFFHLLRRLKVEPEVAIPLFDRALEISRAGADIIGPQDKILIVEGNYLLLNESPWPDALPLYDLTIWIDVDEAELTARLMDRWAGYGKTEAEARAWIEGNDLPNIRRVVAGSGQADVVLR
jgi:pantothenate kinase